MGFWLALRFQFESNAIPVRLQCDYSAITVRLQCDGIDMKVPSLSRTCPKSHIPGPGYGTRLSPRVESNRRYVPGRETVL